MKKPVWRKILFSLAAAAVLLAVGYGYGLFSGPRKPARLECLGEGPLAAPVFTLPDLLGRKVELASFKGNVILIEFWATWCGPCREEIRSLIELNRTYGPQGLVIIGISLDRKEPREVREFAEKMGVDYLNVMGDEEVFENYSRMAGQGSIRGIPAAFLIDREGKIAYVGDPYGAEAAVEKALGLEAGPAALLTAYLDLAKGTDADARRQAFLRLVEKAPSVFDLRGWARGALGEDPPEAPVPPKVDGAKALDGLASIWKGPDAAKRAAALTPLAQGAPTAFDLQAWARAAFAKAFPLTKDELRKELEAGRHGPVLEMLLHRAPSAALLASAAKDAAFVEWCRAQRTDCRADGRRGLMAIRHVFVEKPMDGMDEKTQEKFWHDISVSGMAFPEDRRRVLGLLIGGRMVAAAEAPAYVRDQLQRHVLMTSFVDGKPLRPAGVVAEAKKVEADILAELGRTY
jgi:cytochrome c biogenesis protein CcmG/thiol:disulfide interchange protein DsbE